MPKNGCKLVLVNTDNTSTVHYINCGTGHSKALAALAKAIRHLEVKLGAESVAIHLPGEKNVTADALRLRISVQQRDRHPDRCLRKRFFLNVLKEIPSITIDGICADDGHNAQMPRFRCPSESVLELDFATEVVWVFPLTS